MNQFMGCPPTRVICCPPIHRCTFRCCHRRNIIIQPYICELHTRVMNHNIRVNRFIPRFTFSEGNTFTEQNEGFCPGAGIPTGGPL